MPTPVLSSANRSQLAYKLEGIYPTNFGVVMGGTGTDLNMLSETFDYTVTNETSKQLRSDRQVPDVVQLSATSQGGFAFEAQFAEYDPFIQGVLQNNYTVYGTSGVSAAATGTLTATNSTTLTASVASAGADSYATIGLGDWFTIIPPAGAPAAVKLYLARVAFKAHPTIAATTTVIRLDSSTPIDPSIVTAPIGIGYKISTSKLVNGNVMRSFNIEVGHDDISQYRLYTGMVPSKMEINLSVGSITTGMFDFMGKGFSLLASSSMGSATASQTFTPANATKGVFDIFEGGGSISASTYIKSGSISIDNALRMQDAVGVFGTAGIGAGRINVTGKLEVYFADATIYNKLLNGAASSMTIPLLDVDGNGYIYVFPRIKYTAAKVQTGGLDQDNMLSMEFTAVIDPVTTSPTYQRSVLVYRVGAGAVTVSVSDTTPRFGYALPLDQAAMSGASGAALFASMTNLTGASTGGRNGTFSTVVSATNYTWIAVLGSAAGSGIRVFDGTGYVGFGSAGLPGINTTPSEFNPSSTKLNYTDSNGNLWFMYRSDGKAVTFSTYTLS